jgi:hypothetical protein
MIEQADFARPAMHFARLDKSARLRRVLDLLQSRGANGATTGEIIDAANVKAVSSVVSELRRNGIRIKCTCISRTADAAVYRYRLEQE